jgi:hypothetical protein
VTDYCDYLWVENFGFFTSDGYCLALIAVSTPEEILSSLQASADQLTIVGAQEAIHESCKLTARHDVDGVNTQLLTVAEMPGGWTMLLQAPGFFGISAAMSEIVTTHDVVCHGADRFEWWSRGVKRITFEPLLPQSDLVGVLADRQAPDARAQIIALIGEVGGIDLDETQGREFHHVAGSFALAERLTGIQITREKLETTQFTVAVATPARLHW